MYFSRMNWKLALWLAVMVAMTLACLPSGAPPPLPLGDALYNIEPHDIYRAIELAMTTTTGTEAGVMVRESVHQGKTMYQYVFWSYHGETEMRMAYTTYIEGVSGTSMDIAIDGVVTDAKTGEQWLGELAKRGFWAGTADQVVQYFHLFKAYSASIVSQTTQIWPTVVIVPAALFQESYIDQKLAPMDT